MPHSDVVIRIETNDITITQLQTTNFGLKLSKSNDFEVDYMMQVLSVRYSIMTFQNLRVSELKILHRKLKKYQVIRLTPLNHTYCEKQSERSSNVIFAEKHCKNQKRQKKRIVVNCTCQ